MGYGAVIKLLDNTNAKSVFDEAAEPLFRPVGQGDAPKKAPTFPRSVWTNDRGDPWCELEFGLMYEALKPYEAQALKNGVCLPSTLDHLQLIAHCVTSSMSFAAAASSAARFEAPVPCATLPATSTSTMNPRRCSGPLTSSVRYRGKG